MIIAWFSIEINIFAIVPLIYSTTSTLKSETVLKYIVNQSLPSIIIILSLISNDFAFRNYSPILVCAVCMKLGIAPFHFWFPNIICTSSWFICWILCTLQKIGPFVLIICLISPNHNLLFLISTLSLLISGIGGINSIYIRPLLAYSSIGHIGWILNISIISPFYSILYFFIYFIIITNMCVKFAIINISRVDDHTVKNLPPLLRFYIANSLTHLAGLPPTINFLVKAFGLYFIIDRLFILIAFTVVLSSTVNLYLYMKILRVILLSPANKILKTPIKIKSLFWVVIIRSSLLWTIMLIIIFTLLKIFI